MEASKQHNGLGHKNCHKSPSCSCHDILVGLNVLGRNLSYNQQRNLNSIKEMIKEGKEKSQDKEKQIPLGKVCKVLEATINGSEKFKSESELEVMEAVLNIVSTVAVLRGNPDGADIKAVCGVISAILLHNKPKQPSVVDRLAKIVQKEIVNFNRRLQEQKYDGLRLRVSNQIAQLRTMSQAEKLDDPNLWNDYVQFMGELSTRFELPLSFKYEKGSVTKDPEVADFVTALVTYCQAYSCFVGLLVAAKGKFKELGHECGEVDRKLDNQIADANEKLVFLSDRRYLTFLGRLPYEGGKLMKIVALSRRLSDKSVVEAVRSSLKMTQMPDLSMVESAAAQVSRQSVKIKLDDRHQVRSGNLLKRVVSTVAGQMFWVQFVNETDYPMKVVSGSVEDSSPRFSGFVEDVPPHSSHLRGLGYSAFLTNFSICGYLIVYLNGVQSSSTEPPIRDARVFEFALSRGWLDGMWYPGKINIQDKSNDEFTHGQDTYAAMKYVEVQPLFFFGRDEHFMAKAEIVDLYFKGHNWRFLVQNFDPLAIDG